MYEREGVTSGVQTGYPADQHGLAGTEGKFMRYSLEQCSPQEIIRWAAGTFGDGLVVTSSFQHHSTALLHMVSQICPDVPILFTDTGFHFPETLAFKEQVTRLLSLRVVDVRAGPATQELLAVLGPDLPRHNPDLCCYLHKVLPLEQALHGKRAWITGRRRDQSPTRAALPVLETRPDGLVKINPLAAWTDEDVLRYIAAHRLPPHPLYERGYKSIGCAPCTRPVCPGEHERAGRWPGCDKLECGLHEDRGFNSGLCPILDRCERRVATASRTGAVVALESQAGRSGRS